MSKGRHLDNEIIEGETLIRVEKKKKKKLRATNNFAKIKKIIAHYVRNTCEPKYCTPVKKNIRFRPRIIIPLVNFPFSYFLILTTLCR